ncbi:MAG: AEC family transporter [Fibrobacterota bacterium]
MLTDKIFEIAAITVPVFAIAIMGAILSGRNLLSTEGKKLLSWITYNIALPALIFSSFMKTDSGEIFSLELFILASLPMIVAGTLMFFAAPLFTRSKTKRAALTYCSYWGNNGYMGFPLAASAVPSSGLAVAAVINGFTVPFYILSAVFLIYRAHHSETDTQHAPNIQQEAVKTFFNPVIITLIISSLLSWLRPLLNDTVHLPRIAHEGFNILVQTADLLGSMGLPLALILVGSNLKLQEITQDRRLLTLAVGAKLFLAPLIIFTAAHVFFPDLSQDVYVVLILLNAVPGAVASYIISDRLNAEPDFISSYLVISTALSIGTIPFWLYITL